MIKISRLCKEIGVVPQTIYNWYKKGLIELVKSPTGQYYITEENYKSFLEKYKINYIQNGNQRQ